MAGLRAFKQICDLIRSPTSRKEGRPPSTGAVLLGAGVSLRPTHVQAQVIDGSKKRLSGIVLFAVKTNALAPLAANTIRGELDSLPLLMAGKLCGVGWGGARSYPGNIGSDGAAWRAN